MRLLAFMPLLFLTACLTTPDELVKTPAGITIDVVSKSDLQEAGDIAQVHCQQFDKNAQYVPQSLDNQQATFNCVGKT